MRAAAVALLALAAAAPAGAAGPVRPGPDVLYAPAVDAPQLQNTGVWQAPPILVSGASAYRSGEFLHQDFLYDDLGAGNAATYPADPRYGGNAADLVELRLRPLPGETAFRVTYNTMIAPELAATTIALGSSAAPATMPHGANARMPAAVFVTVHSGGAIAVDAPTGALVATLPVAVDPVRRQVEVRVPHAVFDPTGRTAVRVGAAAGVWDPATSSYPSGLYNAAFRSEPASLWRTEAQSGALASGDLTDFAERVDFTKLAAGESDESGVPQTGFQNRIFASAAEPQQGRSGDTGRRPGCPAPCVVQYAGRLQPYMLFVPGGSPPDTGWPLTIDLHGCGQNHNIGLGSQRVRQLAQRGGGSVVLSPLARGDCYWYLGQAGADVFEAWADVARRLPLDPRATAIAGTSMGGYGALRLAAAYPDLFARAAGIAPCAGAGIEFTGPRAGVPGGEGRSLLPLLPALRNVPVMTWQATADTTCHYARALRLVRRLDELRYRYGSLTFDGMDHLGIALASLGDITPVAGFFGAFRAPRDPPQVTFVASPTLSEPAYGMAADHAYWLSGVTPLHASEPGRIDVLSRGLGLRDPGPGDQAYGSGVLGGVDFTVVARLGGEHRRRSPSRHLRIVSRGVREATVDAERAATGCDPQLDIRSYELLTLNLAGCNRTYHLKRVCHGTPVFDLFPASAGSLRGRDVGVRFRGRELPLRGKLVRIDTGGDPKAVARLRVDVRESSGRRRTRLTLHHFCL